MRKLLFLLSILLLSSCASLDFQIRTLHTANMYDGIYYNTPTRVDPNQFIFFQPYSLNNFWWNYSLTQPYSWYGYNQWSSHQWFLEPYYTPNRFRYIPPTNIVRNRGRVNTRVSVPRTPVRTRTPAIRSMNTRSTRSDGIRSNSNIRTPQPIRRVRPPQRTQVREAQPKPAQRRIIQQTQPTRRTPTGVVIKQ